MPWTEYCFAIVTFLAVATHAGRRSNHLQYDIIMGASRKGNLTCHQCYKSVHGENCITMYSHYALERQQCSARQPFCMVEEFKTDGVLTTFTRKCAEDCRPGCVGTSGSYRLEYCYKCCTTNFCNTHKFSSGQSRLFSPIFVVQSILLSLIAVSNSR